VTELKSLLTRRDFIKCAGCTAAGVAVGLPALADELTKGPAKTKVVLIRHPDAINGRGTVDSKVIEQMLDNAVTALFGGNDVAAAWKQIIGSDDVVGIKSNEWSNLPTPLEVELAIKKRVVAVGVPEENVGIADRDVLGNSVFNKATALINTRPMRTHAWSGVGSLIKNYIMFSPDPPKYHPDSCASLGSLWALPIVMGKTRLNVLVMLSPLFHGAGWHHFDPKYLWLYRGLVVSTDPVAADTIGLSIIEAKRRKYFGEDRPISPSAHHIVIADTKYGLGTSDPAKIQLIKQGWQDGVLI